MSSGKSDIVDVSGEKRAETERAILWFDGTSEAWVPKSQIEENSDGTISMPEWLAKSCGFV